MSKLTDKAKQVQGNVKEKTGELTGNDKLRADGRTDQVDAKARQAADQAKDAVGNAVGAVKDKAAGNR
ncbi:CsbD family protein [Kitasatospora sp. NBC_00315]|uniref:CsbD family protein n=1 Tax=Kitasatospora sp. NBC_00315 TaxID=2975963 RepID=UPI00324D54EA